MKITKPMKKAITLSMLLLSFFFAKAQWREVANTSDSLKANGFIASICTDAFANVYAAGYFTNSSGHYYVAKWNGTTWAELGGPNALAASGYINSVCTDALGNVYAGGYFTNSSGNFYVAKWNGTTWSELGGTNALAANNVINSVCTDAAGNVYVGGYFTNSSSNFYVAKWNGATWTALGGTNALAANNVIYSICIDPAGNVYAGGNFTNGVTSSSGKYYVAKWNGAIWAELGGTNALAANDAIESICIDAAGNVYTGGHFTNGVNSNSGNFYVAKWNGAAWTELGGSHALAANDYIVSVCTDAAGNIYAGGNFTNSTGKYYIAKWNGTTWAELGGVNALAGNNGIYTSCTNATGDVFSAGSFTNNHGNSYVAKYTVPTGIEQVKVSSPIIIVPNPCTTCKLIIGNTNISELQVTDIIGRNITAEFKKIAEGYLLNMENQSQGIYLMRNIKTGQMLKFVKE